MKYSKNKIKWCMRDLIILYIILSKLCTCLDKLVVCVSLCDIKITFICLINLNLGYIYAFIFQSKFNVARKIS